MAFYKGLYPVRTSATTVCTPVLSILFCEWDLSLFGLANTHIGLIVRGPIFLKILLQGQVR